MPTPQKPTPVTSQSSYTVALLGVLHYQETKQENFNVLDIPVGFGQVLVNEINKTLEEIAKSQGRTSTEVEELQNLYQFRQYIALGGEALVIRAFCGVRQCDVAIKIMLPKCSDQIKFANISVRDQGPHAAPELIYFQRQRGFLTNFLAKKTSTTGIEAETKLASAAAIRFNRGALIQEQLASLLEQSPELSQQGYIPKIFEIVDTQKAFYTMEYLDDISLEKWIQIATDLQRITFFSNILLFFENVIHKYGIVHCDIKPENIFVRDCKPIIIDFGMAKNLNQKANVTLPGTQLGSPLYQPPEFKKAVESRSYSADIYELGLLLWVVIVGMMPNISGIIRVEDIDFNKLFPAWKLPNGIKEIFLKATQQNQTDRYDDIQTFRKDFIRLTQFKGGKIPPLLPPPDEIKLLPAGWQKTVPNKNFIPIMESFFKAMGYNWNI